MSQASMRSTGDTRIFTADAWRTGERVRMARPQDAWRTKKRAKMARLQDVRRTRGTRQDGATTGCMVRLWEVCPAINQHGARGGAVCADQLEREAAKVVHAGGYAAQVQPFHKDDPAL